MARVVAPAMAAAAPRPRPVPPPVLTPTGAAATAAVPNGNEALEAALEQLGPFGFYQRYVLVLLCIPNLLAAMYSLNYVFVADQVPFRCELYLDIFVRFLIS